MNRYALASWGDPRTYEEFNRLAPKDVVAFSEGRYMVTCFTVERDDSEVNWVLEDMGGRGFGTIHLTILWRR